MGYTSELFVCGFAHPMNFINYFDRSTIKHIKPILSLVKQTNSLVEHCLGSMVEISILSLYIYIYLYISIYLSIYIYIYLYIYIYIYIYICELVECTTENNSLLIIAYLCLLTLKPWLSSKFSRNSGQNFPVT